MISALPALKHSGQHGNAQVGVIVDDRLTFAREFNRAIKRAKIRARVAFHDRALLPSDSAYDRDQHRGFARLIFGGGVTDVV